jgi:protoporphyrinogen/coproporphyrinogen III oxidase
MQALTDGVARRIERTCWNVRVTRIARNADGTFTVLGERGGQPWSRTARGVVLAAPAYAAATIVAELAPEASRALAAIDYAPVAIVAAAYRRQDVGHPIAGFGCLVPKVERRKILGSLFSSSMFENRAPEGTVILTNFAGGRRNPEMPSLPDAALADAVCRDLATLVDTRAAPLWTAITRWPRAIPQYELGHGQRVAKVDAAEAANPGLWFCANYRGGVSVSDCIKNGHAIAENAHAALARGAGAARLAAA